MELATHPCVRLRLAVRWCAACQFFLCSVLVSKLLHERLDDGGVSFDPIRAVVPFFAVPCVQASRA